VPGGDDRFSLCLRRFDSCGNGAGKCDERSYDKSRGNTGRLILNVEELEAKVRALEEKLAKLEDVEEIERLQRMYGYYLDNCMWDEIVDLFSDNTDFVEIGDRGIFCGKEGVRRLFKEVIGVGGSKSYGELRDHMQLQGIVTIDSDGKTAKGRWRV